MKSEIFSLIVLIIAITAVGCNNNKVEVQQKQPAFVESTLDIDERLKEADSLVVIFYKDPYGTDSVRYTRFYTQISVVEASSLELLRQQLAEKVIKEEQYRKCRGEGKIWCFSNGKIFQTLYFSTRCDKCCHVFIIKDGFYYYSPISPTFVKWLTSIKPLTKEPANEAQKINN